MSLKDTEARDFSHVRLHIKEIYPASLGGEYFTVLAAPASDPDLLFKADIDINDENFSDTYVTRLVCEQITDKISDNLDLDDDSYLFVHAMGAQPTSYDTSISIEEYVDCGGDDYTLYLFVTNDEISDLVTATPYMLDGLDDRMIGFLRVYIVDEEELSKIEKFMSTLDDGVYDPYFKKLTNGIKYEESKLENGQIVDYNSLCDTLLTYK